MRVPLSWLREYVDLDLTPEALAERLTRWAWGQGIERRSDDWRDVVVELSDIQRRPASRRGSGGLVAACCRSSGATNIADRRPGRPAAVLPGGASGAPRRANSEGMLCSHELPDDAEASHPPAGTLGAHRGDGVSCSADVKPNRTMRCRC
jgi:hypothetical protein